MRGQYIFLAGCSVTLLAGCASRKESAETAGAAQDENIVVTAQRIEEPFSSPLLRKQRDRQVNQEVASAPARPVMASPMPSYNVPPVMVAVDPGRERYDGKQVSPVHLTRAEPVSTFSVDVDTGAYANTRRFLTQGRKPPSDAVRTEELINYFRYDYARPDTREAPFSITTDVAATPWNGERSCCASACADTICREKGVRMQTSFSSSMCPDQCTARTSCS